MSRCRASFPFLFAFSLWTALFFAPRLPVSKLSLGLSALAACAGAVPLLQLDSLRARKMGAWLLAAGLGLALGLLRQWPLPAGARLGGLPVERIGGFSGALAEDSAPAAEGARYRVRLAEVWTRREEVRSEAHGEVIVTVRGGPRLYWGREVRVTGSLRLSGEPGLERLFCWASEIEPHGYRSLPHAWRASTHQRIERRLAALGAPTDALLAALILGNRSGVPEQERALFQSSGSLHVLALSGLHVGILYALTSLLLFFIRDRRWRLLCASAILVLYLLLAGLSPSLERAVIMLLAGALGFILDRDARALDLLAISAAAILMIDPPACCELSFQLSFLALLGILLLGPLLRRALSPIVPPLLAAPLSLSLAAQAATTPLLLACFGAAFPAGALAALPLIPLVTIFLWGGLACLGLSLIPLPLLPVLALPMGLLHRAIVWVLGLFSRFPPLEAEWRPVYWIPVLSVFAALLWVHPRPRVSR